ncbi:hypothetical protein [Actinoplanes sp. NPDC026619]|uniref:hypothetical protein n=1 Tax=Actinoplanes sp. NPDC026619 TaxID=3155798 RepID=UPI0033DA7905
MSNPWDEEFAPSAEARDTLLWAQARGASTLGEAYDMLDELELSNDVPEVLGDDGTIDGVRDELDFGLETAGPDSSLSELI